MTQDEIIKLAKAYGFTGGFDADGKLLHDEAFVVAVTEAVDAEREACTAHAITAAEKAMDVAMKLEREAIADEFWSCVMSDLEHGVKSLNEKASFDFQKNMPDLSKFGRWLNERGEP